MPELPEVEGFRVYIEGTCLDQKITQVVVHDAKPLQQEVEEVEAALVGNSFVGTTRIGKYLFLHLKSGGTLHLHFGMTGSPVFFKDDEERPRFSRVEFTFDSGFSLAFRDPRKFGKISLVPNIAAFQKQKKLADDALKVPLADFSTRLLKKKKAVKLALLDQNLVAGIGNWIADEMVFLAKIHPEQLANTLTERQAKRLHECLLEVCYMAIEWVSDYESFPDQYLTKYRWTEDKSIAGLCPNGHGELTRITLGGRGTYYCKICQGEVPTA